MKHSHHKDHPHQKRHQPTLGTHLAGVRTVAVLEALKGAGILLLCLGVFLLLHKDVGEWAEKMVYNLHLDPDWRLARAFLRMADGMTDRKLILLALGAFAYACVRFTEAYGLWYRRVWAEWFAVISGSLYLPLEIYEITRRGHSPIRWLLLLGNIAIIIYLLYIRMKSKEERALAAQQQEQEVVNQH